MNRSALFNKRTGVILAVVLSLAIGLSLGNVLFNNPTAHAVDQETAAKAARAPLYQLEDAFTSIVEQVQPTVVSITSTRMVETSRSIPWFDEEFFRGLPFSIPRPNTPEPQQRESSSFGSGVIVRSDGYILTNDHVVGGADKVTVTLKDGREFEGTVARDPRGDLALIKIDAKDLPAIKIGDSTKVKVGSWAIAIGSPFGLDQTVTVGVVSATGRYQRMADVDVERSYTNMIQTDASINPGNSGGPLVNIEGDLIGINTLIRSSFSGGNIGIGFAIPANTAKFVMDQLIEHGKVSRGQLGVEITSVDSKSADQYGVSEGAVVKSVQLGTAADKAGVQPEDVIVEFDGQKIVSSDKLVEAVESTPPNKRVKMVVVRDKARKTLNVTVGEAPGAEPVQTAQASESTLGFTVEEITPELTAKYNLDKEASGVVVTQVSPGSNASRAGVQSGWLVTHVNGKAVKSVDEFKSATKDLKSGQQLQLRMTTSKARIAVTFTLD